MRMKQGTAHTWPRKIVSLVLAVSFIIPTAFFSQPTRVYSAGSEVSCATGLAMALGLTKIKFIAGILDAPTQENKTGALTAAPDTANQYKEFLNDCVLKKIGQAIVISLIRNIGSSIVNWVNSGFEGSPAFVTDFEGTLIDSADQAIGTFIEGSDLGFLCNDFGFQVRLALALKYSRPFREQARCTLSGIGDNIATNGGRGWDNFLSITTEPQNSVYGAYLIAETELAQRAANAVGIKEKRVALGQGFLDFETCDVWESETEAVQRVVSGKNFETISSNTFKSTGNDFSVSNQFSSGGIAQQTLNEYNVNNSSFTLNNSLANNIETQRILSEAQVAADMKPKCKISSTKTPGRIIASKLESVLGQSEIQSAVADEIDEIIAATMNQLAQKVIQGAHGLLGLSKKRSSSSRSYLSTYQSQYYGSRTTIGNPTVIAATSELDDYRINNYDDAFVMQNSSDPSINPAAQFINRASADTISQSNQQLTVGINSVIATSTTQNIALLKSTSQSSGSGSGNAVNGTTQTSQYIQGSATDPSDANPWWQVDLGESKRIREVRVWSVSGKPASQTLETFRVVIGGGTGNWSSNLVSASGSTNPIVVPINQTGSTVRIEKIATPHSCSRFEFDEDCYYPLELAEVEVIEQTTTPSLTTTATGASSPTAPAIEDTASATSTLAWTPETPTSVSISPTTPLNRELRLSARKTVSSIRVEIRLTRNGLTVPFQSVFTDSFDILRGVTNGVVSSSQSLITPSTGSIRFNLSVNSNSSYSFTLKGPVKIGAPTGSYRFETRVFDSNGRELEDKMHVTSFSI